MKTYDKQTFTLVRDRESGAVFENLALTNCVFDNCSLSLTTAPQKRSKVSNVQAVNCRTSNCVVGPALFQDVTIDGLQTGEILILGGAIFKHVVLKGDVGAVKVNTNGIFVNPTPEVQQRFDADREAFYQNVDWALDISGARVKDLNLQGIPARLIRRDPATQVVVKREKAALAGWKEKVSPTNDYWPFVVDLFLSSPDQDIVLVAPKGKPKKQFQKLMDGLTELRQLGVAEPD